MHEFFIFIIGAMLGGCVGVLVMAACVVAGNEDRFREELERRANNED